MNVVGQIYERPWGTYRTIEQKDNYQIKHIVVKPGKRLSLQYHYHRDEHWTVIKGKGTVQLNEDMTEFNRFAQSDILPRLNISTCKN